MYFFQCIIYLMCPVHLCWSVCFLCVTSIIWVNTPVSHSSCPPYSASLSPSNSPNACGRLLPFRQDLCFLPAGVRWLSCAMCVFPPLPSPPPVLPSISSPTPLLGCNMQERPGCRKALVQIPVRSTPRWQWLFETGKTWKRGTTVSDHWMCCNKRKFWAHR